MLRLFPRPHHLVKNLLILPGSVLAYCIGIAESEFQFFSILAAFIACSLVAAWNYALNDYLDQKQDACHPEKLNRNQTGENHLLTKILVCSGICLLCGVAGISVWAEFNEGLAISLGLFFLSGIAYNVSPVRLKRFPFIDVATEALNFPIRLAIGWYAISPSNILPPLSAILAIWAFGGVLLTGKRAAELARIGNPATARAYRTALVHYTKDRALVVSSLYGMVMLFGSGVLFAVYEPLHNLIFLLPFILLLMGIYLWKLADSEMNTRELEPEKLLKRKSVWLAIFLLSTIATALMLIPINVAKQLHFFGQ